jgi:hypothetical protein
LRAGVVAATPIWDTASSGETIVGCMVFRTLKGLRKKEKSTRTRKGPASSAKEKAGPF